jgi:acyl carrier protein
MVHDVKPAEDGDREPRLDSPSHSELVDIVTAILRDCLHTEIEHRGVDLISNGLVDSFALVELLLELERVLDIRLALDELEVDDFRSAESVARFVQAQIHQARPSAAPR